MPQFSFSEVESGYTFPCFSSHAKCTIVEKLSKGTHGETWTCDVDFEEHDDYEDEIAAREGVVGHELATDRTLQVAVKFAFQKESAVASALNEAAAWARLPPHPNVLDLFHVDLHKLENHTEGDYVTVLYSELLDGAISLERALEEGALLDESGVSRSESAASTKLFNERALPGGVTPDELEYAKDEVTLYNCNSWWSIPEDEKARCEQANRIVAEATAYFPTMKCHESDGECKDAATKMAATEASSRVLDRATLDNISWQIAKGLEHTHRYGLTHFDVSPDNVIIGKGLTVRLVDYGASTAGRELVGASSLWQEHTRYVLAPCEYRSSPFVCSSQSILGRYFSLSPSCEGVDSYEFAVTLLHLWAGRGISPIASNWIVNHTVDLQEGVRKCGTGHSMSMALDAVQRHAEAKHMPVMGDGLKQALAGMLTENWRLRETNMSVAIQAIENRHGGAESFARAMGSDVLEAIGDQKFHVHYARAQTFMEKLSEDEQSNQTLFSAGLRNELTRHARFSAHRALTSAETTSQFVEARDLESWARARSAPVELLVPICSTTPVAFYQCVRFCPGTALLLAMVFLVLGRFAFRHSTRISPPNKLVRTTPVFIYGCVLMPLSFCNDEVVLIQVMPVVLTTVVLWLTIPFFGFGGFSVLCRVAGAATAASLLAWFWMLVVGGSAISIFILLLDVFAFRFISTISTSDTAISGEEQSNDSTQDVVTKNSGKKPDKNKKHVTITVQSAVKAIAMASPIRWTTASRGRINVRMMSPPTKQSEQKKTAVKSSTQQPASKKKRKTSGSWDEDDEAVESPRKGQKKAAGRSVR